MSGRGKPRKDARAVKRRRIEKSTQNSAPVTDEAATPAAVDKVSLSLDEQGPDNLTKGTVNLPPLVEEVFNIDQILSDQNTGAVGKNDCSFFMSVGESEEPNMLRCADDDLSAHVPLPLKQKIWSNKFINIALLLKGNAELSDLFSGGLLHVSEDGKIEAKPRLLKEKVGNIDQWSDAFLIFGSIYLFRFPDRVQEILKYMSIIRDAAAKYPNFAWRTYDEQFRMRQVAQVSNWGKINPDLWMRIMASPSPASPFPKQMLNCKDFNKGFCSFTRCRFSHACDLCGSSQHGMFRCQVGKPRDNNRSMYNFRGFQPNRFARGGRSYRGSSRGSRGFWNK